MYDNFLTPLNPRLFELMWQNEVRLQFKAVQRISIVSKRIEEGFLFIRLQMFCREIVTPVFSITTFLSSVAEVIECFSNKYFLRFHFIVT